MTAAKAASAAKKTTKPAVKAAPKKVTSTKANAVKTAKRGEPVAHAVGRRKAAIARVWLRRGGTGAVTVNSLPIANYFATEVTRRLAQVPLTVVPVTVAERYDYDVNVIGGGVNGQADAIKLAVARALVKADETTKAALKEQGFLTVDARVVERKKYGQKKARRKFQFVKR